MLELRVTGTESWLDERSARRISKRLGAKLWERCQGHRGLFVTLTYRRDEYRDALDLYRRQSEEQHVPLFLRKVSRYLGRSLKGRWFCKLEFQTGGWVHWHLIILDVNKIPHDVATTLWGHGHVWLRRLNKKNVKYVTKYTVKGGDVPAWLYAERPRSVKIVRTSPGFWGELGRKKKADDDEPAEPDPYDEYGPREQVIEGVYVPIGHRIDTGGDRFVVRDDRGKYARGDVDLGTLLACLMDEGGYVVGTRSGWLAIDASWAQLDRAVHQARAIHRPEGDARPDRREEGRRRPRSGRGRLHSIETGNPDATKRRFTWLDHWCMQHYDPEYA